MPASLFGFFESKKIPSRSRASWSTELTRGLFRNPALMNEKQFSMAFDSNNPGAFRCKNLMALALEIDSAVCQVAWSARIVTLLACCSLDRASCTK